MTNGLNIFLCPHCQQSQKYGEHSACSGVTSSSSVAFQYRREQVAKKMAGVYSVFGMQETTKNSEMNNQCAETCERTKLCAACAGPVTEYKRLDMHETRYLLESSKRNLAEWEDFFAARWGIKLEDNQ